MKCRKNVKNLTAGEKRKFVNAFLVLKAQDSILHPGSQSRYDDFVETHLNAMHDMHPGGGDRRESWGHGGSIFLPWHRELLYRFEKLLQGIDPDVTIPYWDWTRARADSDPGYPFTYDFLGLDGNGIGNRVVREPGAPTPYPYAFDPEAWSAMLNVLDHGDELDYFMRSFGEEDESHELPQNDVEVEGTFTYYRAAIDGANDYLTHRRGCESLHNLVHRYVGGNMLRMTSPNDPIFFLHHAAIDRMWSIWQEKVAPGTALYVQSSATAGHKLNDVMLFYDPRDNAPFTTGATPAEVIDGHAMHGYGVWYDSDIPEIDAPDPSLNFPDVPEGLTSFKAVRFKIKGGRKVNFRITGVPTGNFGLTPMGAEFSATPIEEDDFFYGFVWIQLVAVAGAIPNSTLTIHAYLIDDEGYYAATEGGEYPLGDFSVTVTATTVPRENNAVALVLDRSGSMSAPAGGTSTRSQLLIDAIGVFRTLMLPGDQVAVVTFDDVVDTPIAMQTVGGAPAFSTVDLEPRNDTWIGGGIQQGAVQLVAATHSNKSMLVLTDGNQNVHPYIGELPAGTITNRTYAIGFGLPGQVSDVALNEITSNTDGDLIITGNISTAEQRFNLTKYFVQMLAGVTNSQIVLDPSGKLYIGSKDIVPFKISDADVYVDAIALCPIPQFLEFILETPGGQLIKPTSSVANVSYIMGQQVICYRMVLPALSSNATGSHSGTWKAILSIRDEKELTRLLKNKEFSNREVIPSLSGYLPYSFIVHATSNVRLNAWKLQKSLEPGSSIQLYSRLMAYDVLLHTAASIWVEVTAPDLTTSILKMKRNNEGVFESSFVTSKPGAYTFRVRAEGHTQKGIPFTREQTLTAGVYFGNYKEFSTEFEIKDVLIKGRETKVQRIAQVKFDKAGASKTIKSPIRSKKITPPSTTKQQAFKTMFAQPDSEKKKSAGKTKGKPPKKRGH